jgi:hypothetical protein
MSDIFEKYAALRARYPDDESITRVEADESASATSKEYAQLEATQELLALCCKDILTARIKLATDRELSQSAREELWAIVDARLWFVELVSKDYDGELEQVEHALEAALSN